jgi:signal transduction histidine kinase/ligand-binding sensor domain-containing protein
MACSHGRASAWRAARTLALLALWRPAHAEQLPLRTYRGADGLPPGQVRSLLQDRMGYLWVGTGDGLGRFDGRRFVSYGLQDGLPHPSVTTMAEDRDGRIWIGTFGGGIARLEDAGAPRAFRAFPTEPPQVLALAAAADGAIYWTSTDGLYRGRETIAGWTFERLLAGTLLYDGSSKPYYPSRAERDSTGRLWFGLGDRVVTVRDGNVSTLPPPPGAAGEPALGMVPVSERAALVVYPRGLFELMIDAGGAATWSRRLEAGTGGLFLGGWARGAGDTLFFGTRDGFLRYSGGESRAFTSAEGVPGGGAFALATSREGSVWIGTQDSLNRLAKDADVNVTTADGLDVVIRTLAECPDGRLYASGDGSVWEIAAGKALAVGGPNRGILSRTAQRFLCDRKGDLWLGDETGLYRVPGARLGLAAAEKVGPAVVRDGLHADAGGGILASAREGALLRRTEGDPVFRRLPPLPTGDGRQAAVRAMALDRHGGLWAAAFDGTVARFADGRWRRIRAQPGLPSTDVRAMLADSRGRIWLGTRFHGASVCEDPASEAPRCTNHSTRNGLLSDAVRSLAEDRFGRIYLATARGVARLDSATGSWRHFTMRDGLPGDHVLELRLDRRGGLWAATVGGLTRLELSAPGSAPAPIAYLLRVRTPEGDAPLPPRGATSLLPLTLPPSGGLSVEFAAPQFDSEATRFQYRFEGGADEAWGEPQAETVVNFARLAPGAYSFSVRALDADGRPGTATAAFRFRVQAPFWRRPLPQALAFASLAGLVVAAHRWRVSRVLALERLRRQIATDLHDDVGSGLTEIALLSEVARRDAGEASHARLATVAGLARSLRESMSDIVWAVDPRRDRLADLVDRMRQVAFNMAEADGIRVDFAVPPAEELGRLELTPDRKRHLLLAFKEAMNNVVRHSGGRSAKVSLEIRGGRLVLVVADDGRGFEPGKPSAGLGLRSLERRAAEIGGTLDIRSTPGSGTALRLEIPAGR